jgi:hypothetical protein
MSEPIKPEQIAEKKQAIIPDVVIDTLNTLIAQRFSEGVAVVEQGELIGMLVARGLVRREIFGNQWLDFEDIYRKAGWNVVYDKPAYNETYEPTFTFTVGK